MENTFAGMQSDMQLKAAAAAQSANQAPDPKTSDGQKPAAKGQRNLPNNRRGVGNSMRPMNQNGRNNSPDIKRYDSNFLSVIESLLAEEYTVIESDVTKEDDNV